MQDGTEEKVLKIEQNKDFIETLFAENGLDVPELKPVLRKQMFYEVMQEMENRRRRAGETAELEGLDFAHVFEKGAQFANLLIKIYIFFFLT